MKKDGVTGCCANTTRRIGWRSCDRWAGCLMEKLAYYL